MNEAPSKNKLPVKNKTSVFFAPTKIQPWENQKNVFRFTFDFKSPAAKISDLIILIAFVIGFIAAPLSVSALLTFGEPVSSSWELSALFIFPIAAFLIIFLVDSFNQSRLVRSGGFTFFLFYFFFNLFAPLVILPLINLFNISNIDKNTINVYVQDVFELLICLFTFGFSRPLRSRVNKTINKKNILLISVIIIGFVAATLAALFFNWLNDFFDTVPSKTTSSHALAASDNQNSLNDLMKNGASAPGVILLTIIIAPFTEELATRNGIFQIIKNRYFAYLLSVLYFAAMHVSDNNQLDQILLYMGASIVLTTIFTISNYNVTYSILTHSFLNTIITVQLLILTLHVSILYISMYILFAIVYWVGLLFGYPYLNQYRAYKKIKSSPV